MKPLPVWLAGTPPAVQERLRDRRRVALWLRQRRQDKAYRQAEVDRQRERRAAKRAM